jgi:hypothetical protein
MRIGGTGSPLAPGRPWAGLARPKVPKWFVLDNLRHADFMENLTGYIHGRKGTNYW